MAQLLGYTATFLFVIMYIPQIRKMLKSKTIEGVSFWFLAIPVVANIIALCYATLIHQPPLQIKYILSLTFASWVLALYLRLYGLRFRLPGVGLYKAERGGFLRRVLSLRRRANLFGHGEGA